MHRPDSTVVRYSLVFALAAGMAVAGLVGSGPPAVAAEVMPTSAASEATPQRLREIFGGKPLSGLSDLKAMQEHVRTLSEQIKKCTVGVQVGPAWGSGVIVSKDGYILTAAHVAGRPNIADCRVRLADGKEVNAVTLGLYRTLDAGLMKITDAGEWPHAEIADSRKLGYGQWCVAMGHPGGYQDDRGAVLRLGQVLSVSDDAITTNCTLVGGDSGGPLFDMDGKVIGINSRIAEQFYNNMHVPVSAYRERNAWDRMLKGEAWGHLPGQDPWLGVSGDSEVSVNPESKGAKITKVTEKSPAERAGLLVGDVVTAFDSREVADFHALRQAVDDCRPNESVILTVRRGNEQLNVRVRLGRKPE